jgi:Phage small terminase subunit
MTSPAKRHFERVAAAHAAASAAPGQTLAGASHYELMLAKLATDRRRLKSIQSIERKVEVKREVLPEYAAYVAGALEGGRGAQDDVLMTVMIWRIDAGDFAGALDIARYALRHGLTLPDQYERSTAAALAEEFADAALAVTRDGGTFPPDQLVEIAQLTELADMHDQIRAKLHKAIGLTIAPAHALTGSALRSSERAGAQSALDNLRRALSLDARSGVKQNIARLEAALSDAAGLESDRT